MGGPHHPAQMVPRHMGVNLGGDIGMTQQGLDTAQIRPAFHQMGGKGVAQHMREALAGSMPLLPAPFKR